MTRSFRFAVQVKNILTADAWYATARRIESLGYDTMVMPDHVGHHLASMPAMAAAAAATTTLRVSSLVIGNDFRHPVWLAKEAASVDALSGGRYELALGTGWYEPDYEMLGLVCDPPGRRVARLAESVRLIKRLWTEETVDHEGEFYQVRGARVVPPVVQQPHPPILIGGQGPKMLELAAREADIVSVMGAPTAGELDKRIKLVRDASGPRFDALRLHLTSSVVVTDDPERLYAEAAASDGIDLAELRQSPAYLYGPPDSLREQLLANRERYGLSYYVIPYDVMEAFAPVVGDLMT